MDSLSWFAIFPNSGRGGSMKFTNLNIDILVSTRVNDSLGKGSSPLGYNLLTYMLGKPDGTLTEDFITY